MTQVWRINFKPGGVDARSFCFSRSVLGVGLAVDADASTWAEDEPAARAKYRAHLRRWSAALNVIRHRMEVDDLCWARDDDGVYHLARILGDWEYVADPEHRAIDIVNLRRCRWMRVGNEAAVPGKVALSFSRGRTVQRVEGDGVLQLSAGIYDRHEPFYRMPSASSNLCELLGAADCEDLVALFLQVERGWAVVPSTRRRDTVAYEFVLVHRETGEDAVFQSTNGGIDLTPARYADTAARVFLFTSGGRYVGPVPSNVTCLDPEMLRAFASRRRAQLPPRLRALVALSEGQAT